MDKIDTSKYLNEGLIIAGFTLLSYIIAYEFERSFCEYWQLPVFFIKINLTTAIASGLSLFSFLLILFFLLNYLFSIFNKEISEKDNIKNIIIIYHIGAAVFLTAVIKGYGVSIIPLSLFLAIIFLDIKFILFRWYKDKKKYPEHEEFFNRIDRSFKEESKCSNAFDWLALYNGGKIFIFIIAFLPLIMVLASSAGNYRARSTSNFYVIEEKNLVLLKIYDDIYMLRPVDLSKNEIGKDIYIWRNEELAKEKIIKKRLINIKMVKS